MPTTTSTRPIPGVNYSFLLKCLAGVALCGLIISMLMKPTYIVVASAAALAPAAASIIFFPLVALLSLALIVGLAASISSAVYTPAPLTTIRSYPWYTPAYWFGPTYATYSWSDYMFARQPATYHVRGSSYSPTTHARGSSYSPTTHVRGSSYSPTTHVRGSSYSPTTHVRDNSMFSHSPVTRGYNNQGSSDHTPYNLGMGGTHHGR